jgi:hypothetical protein
MSWLGGLDCLKDRKVDHLQRTTTFVVKRGKIHIIDSQEEVAEEGNHRRLMRGEGLLGDLAVYHLDHLLCLPRDHLLRATEDLIDWTRPHLTEGGVPLVCHSFTQFLDVWSTYTGFYHIETYL